MTRAKQDRRLAAAEIQPGGYLFAAMQRAPSTEIDFKVTRAGATDVEVSEVTAEDNTWPAVDRGFMFLRDTRIQKAEKSVMLWRWACIGPGGR